MAVALPPTSTTVAPASGSPLLFVTLPEIFLVFCAKREEAKNTSRPKNATDFLLLKLILIKQ
jgi:hypothetical protein